MTWPPVRIVDAHAHIISSDQARYPYAPFAGALPDFLTERDRAVDAEELTRRMALAGVAKAVLVQYSSAHGYDNRYVLDTAAAHGDRFVAVCTIDGRLPDAPDQLTMAVQEQGAAGVRIRAPGRSAGLEWLTCAPLWLSAQELQVPVCVHFMENVQAEGVPLLAALLRQFPSVRVVLDHAGNPPWRAGPPAYGLGPVLDLARFDQLTIKFATINLERLRGAGVDASVALRILVDGFGADRIMWGSDAPNTPGNYTDMVRWISTVLADFSSAERDWILAGTALRVYPRLASSESNNG